MVAKKQSKTVQGSGFRKRAKARATVKPGKGIIRINKIPLESYGQEMYRMKLEEPFLILEGVRNKIDIDIDINGGGQNSQIEAARIAMVRAILDFMKDEKLKKQIVEYDRSFLISDVRRKEKSKPNCQGKARAKVQFSKR